MSDDETRLAREMDRLFDPIRTMCEVSSDLRPVAFLLDKLRYADDDALGFVCWGAIADVLNDAVNHLSSSIEHQGRKRTRLVTTAGSEG